MFHYPAVIQTRFADVMAWHPDAAPSLPLTVQRDDIGPRMQHICHADFLSLFLVRQGRGTHWIDGQGYGIARGDVYVMGLGQTHWFTDCKRLVLDTVHFAPNVFDPQTLDALASTPGFHALFVEEPLHRSTESGGRWLHLTPEIYARVTALMAELHSEWIMGTPISALLAHGLFLRLLVTLARQHKRRPDAAHAEQDGQRKHSPGAVAAAVRYLDAHFAESVRIEQIATSVFLSADHFTRVFAQEMGQTPRDYLRLLRLERAKILLSETDTPVAGVAEQAGFGDAAYLSRVFQASTGMTPRQWRTRSRGFTLSGR